MDAIEVVEAAHGYWAVQDVEMTLAHMAADIVFVLYLDKEAVPFGGETRGQDALRTVLHDIITDFDFLKYEPRSLDADGDVIRTQVDYVYRHRPTGETLVGSKRLVLTVRDGLIARMDEYHDAALVESFMRLARWRSANVAAGEPSDAPRSITRAE